MRQFALIALLTMLVLLANASFAADNVRHTALYPPLSEVNDREILVMLDPNLATRGASAFATERGVSHVRARQLSYGLLDVLRVPETADYHAELAELNSDPAVLYAGPNVIKHVSETLTNDPLLLGGAADSNSALMDPWVLNNQWALFQTGIPLAWDNAVGIPRVVVAVIDTGANLEHEDLRDRLWTNTFEVPDNGIDDDENGYIDDIHGYDFQHWTIASGGGDSDPTDPTTSDGSHGTATSSIIVGRGDNGVGMAGVAGGTSLEGGARVMVLRVGTDTSITVESEIGAIDYAITNKAKIISMSFGGVSGGAVEEQAIDRAWNAGLYIVAASGNVGAGNRDTDGTWLVDLPAGFPNCVAVGATTIFSTQRVTGATNLIAETLAGYSKFGPEMEICAPGTHIMAASNTVDSYTNVATRQFTGTSAATPIVAGLAALLWSADWQEDSDYDLTNQGLRDLINDSALDMGPGGWDEAYGNGRIQADAAFAAMIGTLIGDFNQDGVVDATDVQAIIDRYGARNGDDQYDSLIDGNNDGIIDELDLFIVGRNFGKSVE